MGVSTHGGCSGAGSEFDAMQAETAQGGTAQGDTAQVGTVQGGTVRHVQRTSSEDIAPLLPDCHGLYHPGCLSDAQLTPAGNGSW